jgi:ribonuclease HI
MDTKKCKNCGGDLEIRETKRTAAQLQKPYYYTAYYYCPNCNKLYHDEKFKVNNKKVSSVSKISEVSRANDMFGSFDGFIPEVEIWTDGACVYNGTPHAKAAWAFVSGKFEKAGKVEGKQTNNVAEGLAIYYALSWAAENGYKKILLHTDSQISLHNLNKSASKVKMNREIFEDIEKLISVNGLEVHYKKVLGHSGDPNNERADKLANDLATNS